MDKPAVLAINKIDIDGADEKVEVVMEQLKNMKGIDMHLVYIGIVKKVEYKNKTA